MFFIIIINIVVLFRFHKLVEHLTYVHFRSLLWVGPALLFSTATAISVLGWDGKVRTILSISTPHAGTYHVWMTLACYI